jgi:ribosome-associated protein
MPYVGAIADTFSKEDIPLSSTDNAAAAPGVQSGVSASILLKTILASLDDDKAEDVVTIPLKGKSGIADYMVICSGRSTRQVSAIAEKLADKLKQDFDMISRVEGRGQGDWVLLDAGDIIVHVFRPEVREFYQLEKLWQGAGPEQG